MRADVIRRRITKLVEARMAELGVPLQEVAWDTWCPLVVPGCPGDLCILPRDHVGTAEGFHVLGTTRYDEADRFTRDCLVPDAPSQAWLVEEGWRRQRLLDESER